MHGNTKTIAFTGLQTTPIDVQVQLVEGFNNYIKIVGLPDKAIDESKERVQAALSSIGLGLPKYRIIINLAPADMVKEGTHYDLPIIIALMIAMRIIPPEAAKAYYFMGELALDGTITATRGTLPAALFAAEENHGFICAQKAANEAYWSGNQDIIAADSLLALINHFKGTQTIAPTTKPATTATEPHHLDIADIRGQELAKRGLEIAAAGGHNMLMLGPPGAGKSMLAARLPTILPPLNAKEMMEVSMIASIAGNLKEEGLITTRPYRDPHHQCSPPALIGGGKNAKPGEITLAHHGVLFMDELPEFQRHALEALRQPIETGKVTIARAQRHVTYPAEFQLIAAMNPCRCGYLDDESRACNKAPKCGMDYQNKLSGPLLDRIDLHINLPALSPLDLKKHAKGESSEAIKTRIIKARKLQEIRSQTINARLTNQMIEQQANLTESAHTILEKAHEQLNLSMRSYFRIIKLARSIADLAESEEVTHHHVSEALTYRRREYRRGGG